MRAFRAPALRAELQIGAQILAATEQACSGSHHTAPLTENTFSSRKSSASDL